MYSRHALSFLNTCLRASLPIPPSAFNMADIYFHRECGTVGCILGWTAYNLRPSQTVYDVHHEVDDLLRQSETSIAVRAHCFGMFGMDKVNSDLFHAKLSTDMRSRTMRKSKEEAIEGLRKCIRYVERKCALWEEHEWFMSLSRKDRRLREQYYGTYNANNVESTSPPVDHKNETSLVSTEIA